MNRKKHAKRLHLSRDTLLSLTELHQAVGGGAAAVTVQIKSCIAACTPPTVVDVACATVALTCGPCATLNC